jgi:hypothetical protein
MPEACVAISTIAKKAQPVFFEIAHFVAGQKINAGAVLESESSAILEIPG